MGYFKRYIFYLSLQYFLFSKSVFVKHDKFLLNIYPIRWTVAFLLGGTNPGSVHYVTINE